MKSKSKRKRTKRTRTVKRQAKLLLKLRSWGSFIDEAYQLESMLARKPKQLQIEFVGSGEIPADTALLMRSMILKRSDRTRIITNARSGLQGATVLIWLLGDTRRIRGDAHLRLRAAGPFQPDHARAVWDDRCPCDSCEMDEDNYIEVLRAIDEFLPVKELVGHPIGISVLKEFGLIESEKRDELLATAFGRAKERRDKPRTSRPKEPAKEASR